MMDVPVVTDQRHGVIGIDLNADQLTVAETDASGNCLNAWRAPLVTYGKNTHQAEAIIGDAVATVVQYAKEAGKPIVVEKLDFRHKKAVLEGESRKYSRMLSSFPGYGKVKAYFISRGYREGVEVHQVNPAYSSVIGRVKFMERYGLTVHQAAALVYGPSPGARLLRAHPPPAGSVPCRQRRTCRLHRTCKEAGEARVDVLGCLVLGQLRPALAAQHRLGKRRRRPNPVQAFRRVEARGWLERGPVRCSSPGEIPGRSRLELLGRRRGGDRVNG